ncbi:MAG TPA: hypothetical protein VFU06_15795 [Longimicrobiales bacterium]|nr:hypothetical protein [Longimicrobiales bacterium]
MLIVLVALPVYRLLDPRETGLAGESTVRLLDIYYDIAWTGLALILLISILASIAIGPDIFGRVSAAIRASLVRPRTGLFVCASALLGGLLSAGFSLVVLDGKPNALDAFAQVLQARYWAAGMLAGPTDVSAAFWGIQNTLFTSSGWVSQYPPGHVALLVPFLLIGVTWLHGPVFVFLTIAFTGLAAHRVLADDLVIARLGTGLLAISPFFLFVGSSLMNHITTAALVAIGIYTLLRAWDGHPAWAVITGVAFALSIATRPLSTLALAGTWLIALPLFWPASVRRTLGVAAAGLAGALPVIVAWLAYNKHFFGSPFRLGYHLTLGPSMGLGFHRDPWGNRYGATEALAYTSSDLTTLGVSLFETPVSAVLVIGAFLAFARLLTRAEWLIVLWAVIPVLANSLYWHHGLYMGPRMLHEAAPAWVLLFTVAAVGLVRRIPRDAAFGGRYFLRPAFGVGMMAAFAIAVAYLAPQRAASYRATTSSDARTTVPVIRQASIIFVHDAWYARIAMPLAAVGMRLDRIETLIRQNPTCRVHRFARAFVAGDSVVASALSASLDTVPRASDLPMTVALAPGDNIRVAPGERLTGECRRQALSDRFGTIDISPLLWQADLHGAPGNGPLIARDLGPERNAQLIAMHPERTPYLYVAADAGARLVQYEHGIRALWFPPDTTTLLLRRQERALDD